MLVYLVHRSFQDKVSAWHQGRLSVVVRLPYCNLRCNYCDVMFLVDPDRSKLSEFTPEELVSLLDRDFAPYDFVTITGGEPLLQADDVKALTQLLVDRSKRVVIETNGSFDLIDEIHNDAVSWVFNYKLSGSGENAVMTNAWFPKLTNNDFVQFSIAVDSDFDEALDVIAEIRTVNPEFENFVVSPAFDPQQESLMMQWLTSRVLEANESGIILNLEIHKLIRRYNDGSEH